MELFTNPVVPFNSYIGKGISDFTGDQLDQLLSKGHWGNNTSKRSYLFLFQEKNKNGGGEMIMQMHIDNTFLCSCHLQINVLLLASSHFLGNFSSIIPESG